MLLELLKSFDLRLLKKVIRESLIIGILLITETLSDSVESLKENDTFAHYYDSNQMYGRLLNHYNIEAKKVAAKELFDVQVVRYWPEIEKSLKEYFS